MIKEWNGKRYHSLNYFLRNKFGEKIYKISLDGGFTCPNRDGKVAKGGCTFCSARGSGDFAGSRILSITEQFEDRKEMMEKKWKDGKYIAYFQAYTNTYAPVEELRKKYEEALAQKNVIALSIATRPDCLDDDVLDYLEELNKKIYTETVFDQIWYIRSGLTHADLIKVAEKYANQKILQARDWKALQKKLQGGDRL